MKAHIETFIAGWNMPGCLPDTAEPLPEFDNTVEAWEYIIDEINLCASEMPSAGSTSSPWPMSAVKVTTSQWYWSCSHLRMIEVSRPPE